MKQCDQDLDWLAFRYVAGELSADEAAAFERRLEDDQASREAVAAAVYLSQCIAAGAPQPTVHPPATGMYPSRRTHWWSLSGGLALAASAAIAIFWFEAGPDASSLLTRVEPHPLPADVAFHWLAVAERFPVHHDALPPEESLDHESMSNLPPVLTAPSWMIAAVGTLDAENQPLEN